MKKTKLEPIPKIIRRLYRLAVEFCRERAHYTCEVCGMKKGDLYNGKVQRVESHHLFSRHFKNSPLKFALENLICLCTLCHKTGPKSAHKNPIVFGEWLRIHKPEQYKYILDHWEDKIDLKDRNVLYNIEENLRRIIKNESN